MSITDELRKWGYGFCGDTYDFVTAIADRIDAEHERECKEQYACGVEHGIGASIDASMIQTHGYVELPKDADGEPIHVGDVMEWVDIDGEVTVTCTVEAVGVGCFFAWDNANGRFAQKCTNAYRHHHAPTVEDVLREFYSRYCITKPKKEDDAILAEYATKLRLAGDAE